LEEVADEDQELLEERLIKPELTHVILIDLLGLFAAGPAASAHRCDDRVHRIARDESRQQEV
jgi:hypothetical protein